MTSLVRELLRLQEKEGWLSDERLGELAERLGVPLHRLESLSTFYTHFRRAPGRAVQVDVCRDLSCALAGGRAARARLVATLADRDDVEVREVSCLGRCDMAPAAAVGHRAVSIADVDAALELISGGAESPQPRASSGWEGAEGWGDAEVYASPAARYGTLRGALDGPRNTLSQALEESGLRGMGGAAFPTGRKWSLVAAESATPRYVICNADESEPGTFKDREILRDLPHLVVEGMALAAYCVGARHGVVFIRHEYEPERRAVEAAIEEARAAGALGSRIFGSGFEFDVEVFVSPGGYILGEETALLECLEDRRGEPRNKPPFPGKRGLFGCPTLINNVETFAHATAILQHGPSWWRGLGKPGHAGHKFISVSGDVAEPGVRLVPFGTTLGELLALCGGMREGRALAAVAPGGASSNFLPPESLELALDFETLAEAGSMLGSGAVVFVGADRDLLEVALDVTRFFRNESCGKCVPCRVGTEKAVAIVEREGGVSAATRSQLATLHATLAGTSICGLGQVALGPLLSIIESFPDRVGVEPTRAPRTRRG